MGDEELIDVGGLEEEFSENAATEIEDEVTPITRRPPPDQLSEREPSQIIKADHPKRGTFIATLRERFAAFFVDTLVLFYLYWVWAAAYGRVFLGSFSSEIPYSGWHGLAFHGSFLLLCFLYYFISEGIFLSTIGKFTCWMSIRNRAGQPASLTSTFVRNVIRPIDYILIIPVIFMMEISKYTQRLGDFISGSVVVKKFGRNPKYYSVSTEKMASATGRTFSILVDMAIFAAFIIGYILIWTPKDVFLSRILLLLTPLAILIYFVAIEMITETSPGKWLMGYIVCHDNGQRITFSGSLIRTLWLLFDINPIGLLCMFISSNKQRPGDLAAGTVITKQKRTLKGIIGLIVAILIAGTVLYTGSLNKTNIFSPKFKFNFLPKLSFINRLGVFDVPEFESIVVQNFRFGANSPTEIRVPPTFTGGETVFLVFELNGYKKKGRKVWLQEDLNVINPDGSVGLKQTNIVDYREVIKGSGPIEFSNNITLPVNAQPGSYQVVITIRDKFAGSQIKESKGFFVRRPVGFNPKVSN